MKGKVIILAEYIGENHNSTAYYWAQIVKSLQTQYEVLLIAPRSSYVIEFAAQYNVTLLTIKQVDYDKNHLLSRLWGQVSQTLAFVSTLRKELCSCEVLFSGTNPIVTTLAISLLRKFEKFRWVLLVHDVFPNNLVPARIIKKDGVLFQCLKFVSNMMYSTPDRLICIGRDMERLLSEKVKGKKSTEFIPNWASTERIFPTSKSTNIIINELNWAGNIVFQFFGNMGRLQGIHNILHAIKLTNNINARFIFIGDGSELADVERYIALINNKVGYQKAYYYGRLALSDNLVGLNACDVAFVSLTNDMCGLGVPSKAYFSMAADKPILYIGDRQSELAMLLTEYPVGWFCEPDNPDKLALLIDNISSELSLNNIPDVVNSRDIMENHFSEKMSLEKIGKVIEEVARL